MDNDIVTGNNDNNGHDESGVKIKGPVIDTSELRREDGLLTNTGLKNQGVIVRAITAITDDKDYRQEMKVAYFKNSDEADLFTSALEENDALGMSRTPLINQMISRSAGENHELLFKALDTITHTTFTTNYQKGDPRFDKRKSSPLS